MEQHFTLSDTEFEQQFNNCTFHPVDFSHEAHLRLAWIHISRYDILQATKNITTQLEQFVNFVGAKDKYNLTLSVAAIKAVYHFWLKSNSDNFSDFILEFPRLKYNFKELMACHYGFDIYNSDQAKRAFLEPDLIPFD